MRPRVALVSMPFAPVAEPSLGLAVLKAQLTREGIEARVFHANLLLLRYLSHETFEFLANWWGVNEFLFTAALDHAALDHAAPNHKVSSVQLDALADACRHASGQMKGQMKEETGPQASDTSRKWSDATETSRRLLMIRHEIVPRYLADVAAEVLAWQPTMVGLTCMFDQVFASVALAAVIKETRPEILTVCGGYALEGPPGREILNAFPEIDCVAAGDGEPVIGRLAAASVGDGRISEIPGVISRTGKPAPPVRIALDASPDPDYADWYADIDHLLTNDKVQVRSLVLPIEASRGCWWGEKKHCVFCGIDDVAMTYRAKAPETVLRMLSDLRSKHRRHSDNPAEPAFRFSDYIFPFRYQKDLLPRLAAMTPKYNLVCEVKANQSPASMAAFAEAGFRHLQPGIESFSSKALKSFDKGVSAIQNVFTLKLGYLNDIVINYNVLYGLPTDELSDYKTMVARIPLLYHLTPPVGRSELAVTRFSPLQTDPARFGHGTPPVHHRRYDVLFSETFLRERNFSLDSYGYYFARYFDYPPAIDRVYRSLIDVVSMWQKQHAERDVFLSYEVRGDAIRFQDARFGSETEFVFGRVEKEAYLAVDARPTTLAAATIAVAGTTGLDGAEVRAAFDALIERRLLWVEEGMALGLAIERAVVEARRGADWRWGQSALILENCGPVNE